MRSKPALRSIVLTMSGPAIENGPGPQCTWSVSSCETTGTISLTRSSASCSHGFSSRRRHTIIVNLPPGFSALRMLRSAAPGIMKNIVPKRENAKSYGPAQVVGLHVGDEERRVGDARVAGLLLGRLDEVLGAVDADGLAPRPDAPGDEPRAVAEAAADVEHARALR